MNKLPNGLNYTTNYLGELIERAVKDIANDDSKQQIFLDKLFVEYQRRLIKKTKDKGRV